MQVEPKGKPAPTQSEDMALGPQGDVWGHRGLALPGGRSSTVLCGLDVLPKVQTPTRTHLLFTDALKRPSAAGR